MRKAISHRKGIPFFYSKSELEFQQDIYERFHEMVLRQSLLHNADQIWDGYPFQPIFLFAKEHYPKTKNANILEININMRLFI